MSTSFVRRLSRWFMWIPPWRRSSRVIKIDEIISCTRAWFSEEFAARYLLGSSHVVLSHKTSSSSSLFLKGRMWLKSLFVVVSWVEEKMKHVCWCDVSHIIPLCHNFSSPLITLMAYETATTKAGKQMKDKEQRMISAPQDDNQIHHYDNFAALLSSRRR